MIDAILKYNQQFVKEKKYEPFKTSKFPDRKLAIVTCMDTRLTELLPAALGIKNGDAKIIKNAGGTINHPFGSAVRSLLVAVYELGVKDIMVIGHTDCGVQHMEYEEILEKMQERGVSMEAIDMLEYSGIPFQKWLSGFEDTNKAIIESVELLKKHPLLPKDIKIYGCIMDTETGELLPIEY